MSGKAFFIDTTLCTACRSCQVACKQWNQLPATSTENRGSYQNPDDLGSETYKLVRFEEHSRPDNTPVWYFFSDQCRHCVHPACKDMADMIAPGAVTIDSNTGAVLYNDRLNQINSEDIRHVCPYDIPRADHATGRMAKCTMCKDRVHNGLLPACVKTCPTGAMNFGDRDEMIKLAEKRGKDAADRNPNARLTGLTDLRVFYLLLDEPAKYHLHADVKTAPRVIDRKLALKEIGQLLATFSKQLSFFHRGL